ncbi:MAG: hypothetical protein KBD76_07685 [Bacteriovorax sp.]|nr:hypothetical protein [Bacteriovorax sp.]
MKMVILCLSLFFSVDSFANLYLKTEYQEGRNPKIITRQHIFLEKRFTVKFKKKIYVFILKKINADRATIESESYNVDEKGFKTMHGGAYGTYNVGKSFQLIDRGPGGDVLFSLKVFLERVVATPP